MQPDDNGKWLTMDSFEFILKNEKLNSYNKVSYLVSAFNFIFFIFYAFYSKHGYERVLWLFFSILIPVFCFTEIIIRDKLRLKLTFSITYFWLLFIWPGISLWMALIHLILLISDSVARRKLNVYFNTGGIGYPSFPKKNIPWNSLSNVVLKDGLLTIDFKNNHLLQAEIITTANQIDETTFNHYCEQQLKL